MTRRVSAMPALATRSLLGRRAPLPSPLDREGVIFWYNARAAIWQGVHSLALRPGDRILVPAYSCGSELDPLLKAGMVLDYYRLTPELTADLESIASICRIPARALLVTHYFGFPQPMEQLLTFAKERDLLLIEDNSHGLYSMDSRGRPLGTFGDMAVFSLSKTLPVPDGGALLFNRHGVRPVPAEAGRAPDPLSVAGRVRFLCEQAVGRRFPSATAVLKKAVLDPLVRVMKRAVGGWEALPTESDSDPDSVRSLEMRVERAAWRMSSVGRFILSRLPHEFIRETRKSNFSALSQLLEGREGIAPLIPRLRPGCCPLFFPVLVRDPPALQRYLAGHGVGCKRFWSSSHPAVPLERFPFESRLKRSVLALPVHQDLVAEDLAHVAEILGRGAA